MALKLKDLPDDELLSMGSLSCSGCGQLLAFRHALKVLGKNTIAINSTGCLAVIMQMGVPKVPHFHVLFENGPAVISGIDSALRVMGKREGMNLLVAAGDGGTADIGIAALSGAIERNQDFIYICFDNESYMNTGGQRSGTTWYGAKTSTTPVGKVVRGEERTPGLRKDMVKIIAAHGTPYVASTSIGYPLDFMERVEKAKDTRGPSYIHCHAPCPPGWGIDAKDVIKVAQLAVQTGFVKLFEIEDGVRRVTKRIAKLKPVEEYLKYQARYKHILQDEEMLAKVREDVAQS
ncbi:MAG: thiamine pyrophosphate-dependent enzyme [bacterium]